MRVLIFIYSLGCGGAERVAANLANHWAAKGWDVTLVTVTNAENDFYPLHPSVRRIALNHELRGEGLLLSATIFVCRVASLRRVLRQVRPDVALGMMPTANTLLALARLGLGIPTVGSEHNHPAGRSITRIDAFLRRHTYRLLDAVVGLTEETAQWLMQNTRARCALVIPNAVSWPLPKFEPVLLPMAFVRPGDNILLAVGRLEPEKGFDLLIKAFAPLAEKYPDWILVVLGEGGERVRLETLIDQHGLHGRILLPGRVGNVGEWYNAAGLYVMSSRSEGFPNTLVEALASGVPAISFDCDTGPRHIIRHAVDGLLVPPGDVVCLTDAMDCLMGNEPLRKCLAMRAADARERFAVERIAGLWERAFTWVHQI